MLEYIVSEVIIDPVAVVEIPRDYRSNPIVLLGDLLDALIDDYVGED